MADPVDVGSIAVAVVPSARDFTERMRATLLPQADALGREVGDRIRAGVDSRLRDVRLGVNADTAKANAELDKTKLKADELGAKDEKIKVDVQNSGSVMGWLVSAVAAAVAIAPAFAVAGVGVAAFTALAIPSLKAVTKYEHDAATGSTKTAAEWQKLTGTQKAMAAGLTSLNTEFHQMAEEIDPQVMQVFEAAVSDVDRILPEIVPLAKAAGSSIAGMLDTVGNALTDSQAQQFFDFVAKNIGPDMAEIDQVIVALVHTLFNLIEALQPTSLMLLHLVSGFAELLSWISKVAPPLDSVIVLAIALYRPLKLVQGLELAKTFSWIPSAVSWMKDFAAATEGATAAEKAQLAVELALDAVNPFWWVAGAIAGGVALGLVLRNVSHGMSDQVNQMAQQDQAIGYNISGYQKLAQQTGTYAQRAQDAATKTGLVGQALGHAVDAQRVMTAAQQQASQAAVNLNNHLDVIQGTFGLTRTQAEQLAKAAGVTADQLTGTGSTAQEAMRKILAYGSGTQAATQTTHALALAVQSLTAAMQTNIGAVLTLEGDEVSWKQAQQAATKAIDQNKKSLDGNSASALAARQAIIQATSAVVQFASDQLKLHGNLQGASNAIQDQIKWLEQHAGKSKIAAQEIRALRDEEAKIKAQINSQIKISGTGTWALQGASSQHLHGLAGQGAAGAFGAQGLYITQGTTSTADDVLARVSKGELVVPTRMVDDGEVDHLRGRIPGFASGGIAGSYSGSVPGETKWLTGNLNATFDSFAGSLASSFTSALTSAVLPTGPLSASAAKAEAFARSMLAAFGWGASQWPPLQALWTRESGWNAYAVNPSSGAYGIPQSLGHGHPYALGDYVAQVMWGLRYILGRYGSPAAAWGHEVAAGWYDSGGWLPPGAVALNGTGRPEPILSDAQWRMLSQAVSGGNGAAVEYHAHFDGMTTQAIQSNVRTAFRAMEMQAALRQRVGRRR